MHDIYSMFLLVTYYIIRASLVAQTVKNLPAMLETQVWYLGWEDPFKRAWQPILVFLPGEFREQRCLVGYSPWDRKESNTTERLTQHYYVIQASLLAQMVKNLPAMKEPQVWSLRQEDTLEKGMATHSSFLAWRIPWTEKSSGLQSMGLQRVGHNRVTNTFTTI